MGSKKASNMRNEKNPGWLGYIGDYTTQLYRDYNKPFIKTPINQPVQWKVISFFCGSYNDLRDFSNDFGSITWV